MQSVFILGRQPAIGIAELESLFGAAAVRPIPSAERAYAAAVDIEPKEVDFDRMGGSVKFARVLRPLDTNDWSKIEAYMVEALKKHAAYGSGSGKLRIGLSAYGFEGGFRGSFGEHSSKAVTRDRLLATGLNIKKAIKASGRSVRIIPNTELALNSASVLHNGLTSQKGGEGGWELLLIRDGAQTLLAQTVAVQDIDAYTLRDRGRPKRDARVGMLPPKLAQIIINLANPPAGGTVLDPFCGTGVLLQEALLMGYSVYGTDLELRMIDYTRENLEWLKTHDDLFDPNVPEDSQAKVWLEVQDAAQFVRNEDIDAVASETYLGRPFTSLPDSELLAQTVSEVNTLLKKFLRALHGNVAPGTRICLAVPAWQVKTGAFKHLPLIDSLAELGYNRISFEHAGDADLIYFRPDQIVARQLLVISRN